MESLFEALLRQNGTSALGIQWMRLIFVFYLQGYLGPPQAIYIMRGHKFISFVQGPEFLLCNKLTLLSKLRINPTSLHEGFEF